MTILVLFDFAVDPCSEYKNLTDLRRKSSYVTPTGEETCDNADSLPKGWYRFVGAAGTKMPTMRVAAFRCGAAYSGWLNGIHPTVENGEVFRDVCFSNKGNTEDCKYENKISVKNCSYYYIYKLHQPPKCASRYCGAD